MKTTFVIRNVDIREQPIRLLYLYGDQPIPPAPPVPRRVQVKKNLRQLYDRIAPVFRDQVATLISNGGDVTFEDFVEEDFDVVVIPKFKDNMGMFIQTVSARTEKVIFETVRDLLRHGYKPKDIRSVMTYFYPITWDDVQTVMDRIERGEI